MTDCRECSAASADRAHAIYRAGCTGCAARAIASGPLYWQAKQSGRQFAAYRQALQAAGVTHDDVKAAATRMQHQEAQT